ncbi:MAG: thioredoxin domain-containing protein, partial [Syntrophales bacterium]|nr:thioredoxin domain-containing protein [Syntrophales bacterium]
VYSAEDADSEGKEGKFYVWTEEEIRKILPKDEADFIIQLYGVAADGNFKDEATQEEAGQNILHLKEPLTSTASRLGISVEALKERVEAARQILFIAREGRIHPLKDDKILTDWNGLMIAALARGAQVLGEPRYLEMAKSAIDFIFKNMSDHDGRLLHRFREGETSGKAHLDDYAFMVWGLLETYEASFDPACLKRALMLQEEQDRHFRDGQNGGYFFTADDGELVIARQKESYDGAIPSGNAVSMLNLIRLGRLTGDQAWEENARRVGEAFAGMISRTPSGFTMFMVALTRLFSDSCEIVIAGDPAAPDTGLMLDTVRQLYLPDKSVLVRNPATTFLDITGLAPFTKDMVMMDGKATAYVCIGQACRNPTNDPAMLRQLLNEQHRADKGI